MCTSMHQALFESIIATLKVLRSGSLLQHSDSCKTRFVSDTNQLTFEQYCT